MSMLLKSESITLVIEYVFIIQQKFGFGGMLFSVILKFVDSYLKLSKCFKKCKKNVFQNFINCLLKKMLNKSELKNILIYKILKLENNTCFNSKLGKLK